MYSENISEGNKTEFSSKNIPDRFSQNGRRFTKWEEICVGKNKKKTGYKIRKLD